MLWNFFFSLFGVSWATPDSARDSFLDWEGSSLNKDKRRIWKVGPVYIFWTVWQARDNIVCRDDVLFIQRLKSFISFG